MNETSTYRRTLLLLLAAAFLLQLPIILNPGYYNHDELQWASWSVGRPWHEVPWARLSDWETFQYRPLTFNVWMQLSRWFFDTPYLMHAACVLIGLINVGLLWIWLRHLEVCTRAAFIACLVWVLNPYTMHTHGWVGTIADSLWVMFALIAITSVNRISVASQSQRSKWLWAVVMSTAFTALALLSKEAALVIPAAFMVASFRRQQRSTQIAALLGSSLSVALYLALRLQVILSGAEGSSAYSIAGADPLSRWLEYLIFPGALERGEPRGLLLRQFELNDWSSVTLISLLTIAVWRSHWRLGALWILAPLAALVPILLLPFSAGHYAYAASLVACVILTQAASSFGTLSKIVVIFWLSAVSFHGLQVAKKMHRAGVIQNTLAEEVNQLRRQFPERNLRIRAQLLKHEPHLRTLFRVPSYHQVPWGEMVTPVNQGDASANYQMLSDGRLEPWQAVNPFDSSVKRRRLGPPD
jgi:hypothetical protein